MQEVTAGTDILVVTLEPLAEPGVGGMAWLVPAIDEEHTLVTVLVWGLEPGAVHTNHIHSAPCRPPSPIATGLVDLVANEKGVATASTLLEARLTDLTEQQYALNVHRGVFVPSSPELHPHDPSAAGLWTCGNLGS